MSKSAVVTARVPPEVADSLAQLADRTGRSRAWLIAEAIREYTTEQAAFLDFIDEGERDIDEGRFHTQEEMEAWFAERIAEAKARQAEKARAA